MKCKVSMIVIVLIGFISTISPQQTFRRAVFLHQSVGSHIYQHEGASTDVPTEIISYNTVKGFTGPDRVSMDKPIDYPTEGNMLWLWWSVFNGTSTYNNIYDDYINNTAYDIIIMKECFESQSDVWWYWHDGPSDTVNYPITQSIYNYQWYVRKILRKLEEHPEKFFVWWTIPPIVDGTIADAQRLYSFNKWMVDTLATGLDASYGDFPTNVYIFDYFSIVANASHLLPLALADAFDNSHPNAAASELVAPLFVNRIFDAAIAYETSLLPVELSYFSASMLGSTVKLNWRTETEVNNYGFEVERKINSWEIIGFVPGNGNSNTQKSYFFIDKNISNGKYFYRLKQIDNDGHFEYSKVLEMDFNPIPTYSLEQNYPNPFNPTTKIRFNLSEAGNIKLTIYNLLGKEVRTLINEYKNAGTYTINFDASELSSGPYIYRLTAGTFTNIRKMIVIK